VLVSTDIFCHGMVRFSGKFPFCLESKGLADKSSVSQVEEGGLRCILCFQHHCS